MRYDALDMNWTKVCYLESSNHVKLKATLFEFVNSNSQSIYTWPCSLVLALYIATHSSDFINKRIIELGAGTALPSIISGKCGCSEIIISDRDDEQIKINSEKTIIANNLQNIARYVPVVWGSVDSDVVQSAFDIILGADVFYSTEDFDNILLTIFCLLQSNPNAVFLTTYQERSNRRTLQPYLRKYKLAAELIPLSSFIHDSHGGLNDNQIEVTSSHNTEKGTAYELQLMNFDSIHLIKITK